MGAAHNLSSESESKTESKSQDASIERDGSANPERSNIQLQLDPELESTTKVDKKENDDDQDDGFTTVSRFRYASVDRGGWGGRGGRGRGRKNRKGHGQSRVGGIHGGEGHAQAPIYSEEDQSREAVNQRLERRLGIVNAKRRVVQESKFWTAFLEMLDEVLGKPRTPDPEDAPSSSGAPSTTGQEHEIAVPPSPSGSTNSFETAVSTMSAAVPASATTRVPEPAGILCLGIGSIKDNRVAQLQLVLLLIMSERIAQLRGSCPTQAYDPLFNEEDHNLLRALGVEVLSENKRARHELSEPTLVYMPHCGRGLYENMLRTNWTTTGLSRMLLCCNSLEGYGTFINKAKLEAESPCISRIAPYLSSKTLPPLPSPNNDAFNDLAFQWLPSSLLTSAEPTDNADADASALDERVTDDLAALSITNTAPSSSTSTSTSKSSKLDTEQQQHTNQPSTSTSTRGRAARQSSTQTQTQRSSVLPPDFFSPLPLARSGASEADADVQ